MCKSPDSAAIIQNLKDAGCDNLTIERFMQSLQLGRCCECYQLLEAHRRALLDALHSSQRQIDCLDYLVYTMKKSKQ